MKLCITASLVLAATLGGVMVASGETINIDAAVNGSPYSGFPQVEVPVTPGHYRATLVNPSMNAGALSGRISDIRGEEMGLLLPGDGAGEGALGGGNATWRSQD